MSIIKSISKRRNDILKIASKYGVKSIKIFGSVAREDDNSNSDIDFLVDFEEDRSLFDLILLKDELQNLLHREVDVVTMDSLHWAIRENIRSEVI